MEINALRVKSLRKQHQWTQQQLAEMCGVSLRTIQRVEKEGNAATETVMGLCAVLEIPQDELAIVPKVGTDILQSVELHKEKLLIAGSVFIGMLAGGAVMYWLLGHAV